MLNFFNLSMGGYAYASVSPALTRYLRQLQLHKKPPIERLKKFNIVRGDTVYINAGKERGKRGVVKDVDRNKNAVIVEGLNLVKKHVKSTPEHKGGIFTKEMPLHYSNLMLIDPVQDKPTRIKRAFLEDGTKARISKLSGAIIPKPPWVPIERPKDGPLDTPSSVVLERTYFPSHYPAAEVKK